MSCDVLSVTLAGGITVYNYYQAAKEMKITRIETHTSVEKISTVKRVETGSGPVLFRLFLRTLAVNAQ